MSENIFDKWDSKMDLDGLQKDIQEAAENGGSGDYKEVPHGKYEVAVEKMELKPTKKGDPMVSIWFKIVSDGEFKGSMIFFNQVITKGFQIHIVNEFLRSLTEDLDAALAIEFKTYAQYSNLIMDVHEAIADSFEYGLDYGQNKNGYNTFKITDIFPLDD